MEITKPRMFWVIEPHEVRRGIYPIAKECFDVNSPPVRPTSPWLRKAPVPYIEYSAYKKLLGEVEDMMRVDYWHEQYSALKKQYDKLIAGEAYATTELQTVASGTESGGVPSDLSSGGGSIVP